MIVLGIDPGETQSGIVCFDTDTKRVLWSEHIDNEQIERDLRSHSTQPSVIVCEDIVPMGVPFSSNVRATCRAIDRLEMLAETLRIKWVAMRRNDIKVALCGRCQGIKDANVACAVQERFGGKDKARGTKKEPGPCYGVSGHAWQALAAVVAWLETKVSHADLTMTDITTRGR